MSAPSRFAFLGPDLEQLLKPQFTPQSGLHIFGNLEPMVFVDINAYSRVGVTRGTCPELVMVTTTTRGTGLPITQDMTPDAALEYAAALGVVANAIKATHP